MNEDFANYIDLDRLMNARSLTNVTNLTEEEIKALY